MRLFTVTERGVEEGIRVHMDPYPHIALGERGRGRWLERVALGRRDFPNPPERLAAASLLRIKKEERQFFLLAKEEKADPRALVKLAIPAGYRGSTSIALAEGVIEVTRGTCAQGIAGRMGHHDELLVIASKPGVVARVERFGRLYGAPAHLVVAFNGESVRVGPEDEVFPPSDETTEGAEVL